MTLDFRRDLERTGRCQTRGVVAGQLCSAVVVQTVLPDDVRAFRL